MFVIVNDRLWIASSVLLLEMFNSLNFDTSAMISRHIAPNTLMLADKHDPKNVTKYTNSKLLSVLPSDELLCATLLPVQAWNDKIEYFAKCRLLDACRDFAVVVDSKGIHFIRIRLQSIVQKFNHTDFTVNATSVAILPMIGTGKQQLKTVVLIANVTALECKQSNLVARKNPSV